jgi:hypothetical protein
MTVPEHRLRIASRGQPLIDALGVELCSFVAMPSSRLLLEFLIRGIRHSGKTVRPNPVTSSFQRTATLEAEQLPAINYRAPWDPAGEGTTRTVTVSGTPFVNKSNGCVANFEFT